MPIDENDGIENEVLDEEQKQQKRKERAVKEREDKVNAELGRLELDIARSRRGIHQEEGERDFKCAIYIYFMQAGSLALNGYPFCYRSLLTDAVRDPQVRALSLYEQWLIDM